MTKKTQLDSNPNNQPVDTVDHFPLRAAIWNNTTQDGQSFFSVTFERAYKKDDQWSSSQNFGRSDLLALAKLADATDTRIRELIDRQRVRHGASEGGEDE